MVMETTHKRSTQKMRTARRSPFPSLEGSGEAPREGGIRAVSGGAWELSRRNARNAKGCCKGHSNLRGQWEQGYGGLRSGRSTET